MHCQTVITRKLNKIKENLKFQKLSLFSSKWNKKKYLLHLFISQFILDLKLEQLKFATFCNTKTSLGFAYMWVKKSQNT